MRKTGENRRELTKTSYKKIQTFTVGTGMYYLTQKAMKMLSAVWELLAEQPHVAFAQMRIVWLQFTQCIAYVQRIV